MYNRKHLSIPPWTLPACLAICCAQSLCGQVYVNKEWERTSGLPDTLSWSATSFDINGNVIAVGNTQVAPGNPDILVVKMNDHGTVLWERTFGGPDNAQDYGVAAVTDQFGHIYVAGVVTSMTTLMDVAVLKYAPNGDLLWSRTFNGPGNLFDVPRA
ncbi:MAG: hypothetical protein KF797_05250 [Flavobacteriales bacterium]|nr:hypothetical protein [Flavobacteriales bacterium]